MSRFGKTISRDVTQTFFDQCSKKRKLLYYEYLDKMNSGFWDWRYLSIWGQNFERTPFDILDAVSFAEIHCYYQTGAILINSIHIGIEPWGDRSENWEKFERVFSRSQYNDVHGNRFEADFSWSSGTQGCDAYIKTKSPLSMDRILMEEPISAVRTLSQGFTFQVEVGYQCLSKTYVNLCNALAHGQTLARWPYHSKNIIFLMFDKLYFDNTTNEKPENEELEQLELF